MVCEFILINFTFKEINQKWRQRKQLTSFATIVGGKIIIYQADSNLSDPPPLDWCNQETRQLNGREEFTIPIMVLHASLTFHPSASNWLKLHGSFSDEFIHYKNEPIQWFKYRSETLLPLSIVAPRSAVTFRGFELGSLSPLFRRFAVRRALIKSKLVAVPILILNPLVTVFYGSVLAYKVFQESFFPILGFFTFGLRKSTLVFLMQIRRNSSEFACLWWSVTSNFFQ